MQAGVARRIASVRAIILESWGRWQRAEGQTECPLLGAKQTPILGRYMSAFSHKQTFGAL